MGIGGGNHITTIYTRDKILRCMLVHVIYMGDDDNGKGNHYRYLQNKEITETIQQLQEIMNIEHKRSQPGFQNRG